ncbi:MAG: hypothetical protein AAF740_14915 [Bacteroidota bacterium]
MSIIIRGGRFLYRKLGWAEKLPEHQGETLKEDEGNALIKSLILADDPVCITRLGASETFCLKNYLDLQESATYSELQKVLFAWRGRQPSWSKPATVTITNNAGVFPGSPESLSEFSRIFLDYLTSADMLCRWDVFAEAYFHQKYCPQAKLSHPEAYEPYYHQKPWSGALKGKKVLVIHPYKESILSQYQKRELLFDDEDILPAFDLKVVKAVQSIAGSKTPYKSWVEALRSMEDEIRNTDFEVAIIGAGAYGLPLAAFVKRLGKKAIHIGGATQILFGIKGKRWDDMPRINRFYNEHWVRPLDSEKPQGFKAVESGAYW